MLLNDFMKSKFFLISALLLIFFQQVKAQGWERYYGGDYVERGYDVRPTTDGGFIATGNYDCNAPTLGGCDIYMLKVNAIGDEEWLYIYNDSNRFEYGYSVIEATDGGFIAIGGSDEPGNTGSGRGNIVKVNALGQEEWARTTGDSTMGMSLRDIKYAEDNGYIISGIVRGDSTLGSDVFLLKINENGDEIWRKIFGNGTWVERGYHVQTTQDGGYLVVGFGNDNSVDKTKAYILKTDELGNEEWSLFHGEADKRIYATSSTQLDDGSYLITMCYDVSGTKDFRILRVTENGSEDWMVTFPEFAGFEGGSAIALENNEAMVVNSDFGGINYRRFNAEGDVLWHHRELTISSNFTLRDQVTYKTPDGGYISTGAVSGVESNQIGLIKADSLGQVVVSIDNSIVKPSNIFEVYPNPMHEEIKIANKDLSSLEFEITIFDAHGREVIYQESNEMNKIINVKELSSGIYYYQIKTEDKIQNGKLIKVE